MKSSRKPPTFVITACVVFLFLAFLLFVFESSINGLVLVELLFGWIPFARTVFPRVQVRWDGVLTFFVGFVISTFCFHSIATWLLKEIPAKRVRNQGQVSPSIVRWRIRSSIASLVMVLLIFAIGIAMAGIVHQTGWIVSSPYPLIASNVQSDEDAAMSAFDRETTPSGLSWIALILHYLPYNGVPDTNDHSLPFHAPRNADYFKKYVPQVFCPSQSIPTRTKDGFGLSHCSANPHLADFDRKEINSSSVVMLGEVNAGFMPWGDPSNLRDVALGIRDSWTGTKKGQVGFGSRHFDGANFAFMDGSVVLKSSQTDPEVLRQMSGSKNGLSVSPRR